MLEAKAIHLHNGQVPVSLYDATVDELNYLKGLIPQLLVNQIKALEQEKATLSSRVDFLNGQVSQFEKHVEDLKKAHSDGRERQKGYWEGQVKDLTYNLSLVTRQKDSTISENKKLSAEIEKLNSEISELKAELEKELIKVSLLEGMDNKLDAQSDKLDRILNEISSIPALVKAMLDSNCSKEEIVSTVEQEVSNIGKIDTKEVCEKIYILTQQGLKNKAIAEQLGWLATRGPSKVSEYRKHPDYISITGVITDEITGVITGVLRE